MSESIARKVQPFTIGTRLSVPPVVSKCPADFTQNNYLLQQSQSTLDNCNNAALQQQQHNLNDTVSLYLSRSQVCSRRGPCLISPRRAAKRVPPVDPHPHQHHQEEDMAAEDHLNQNVVVVSPSAVSRSIKKITISGNGETRKVATVAAGGGPARFPPVVTLVSPAVSENINNNNNNSATTTTTTGTSNPPPPLPRIVGVSCENKPSSHFKVLLTTDSTAEHQPVQGVGHTMVQLHKEKSTQQTSAVPCRPRSPRKELQRKGCQSLFTQKEAPTAVTSQSDCFAQRNSLFSKEILQAEAWIKGKMNELKDGCNVQRCPLQDWAEVSQSLQRDLKDFENTLIQLNQMGEQLICKLNPTSDLVKKQLGQLRDQWQVLKQTAANQSRALGGAKSLQEFNKKVDKLEAWIKDKEQEQSLLNVLGENVDKLQLTRRILDLKQDEQLHRNLHEEINHLALKLEKQGRTDGRNISGRRKHINKMWLKVQSHLKHYHENLQLALEVSSFYQEADNTLFAMNNMRKSISASRDMETCGDREIRDLASQIMMLDVTVSQLSNLHPALAAGVTQKQSELKDCWAVLQKTFRSDRTAAAAPSGSTSVAPAGSTPAREDADPLTSATEPHSAVGTDSQQRVMGKEVKEEQNRLKGCVNNRVCVSGGGQTPPRSSSHGGEEEEKQSANHTPAPSGGDVQDDVMVGHQSDCSESRRPRVEPKLAAASQGHPQLHAQLQKFTVSADKTLSWLKDNVAMATQVCSMARAEGLDTARRCQDALEQEILSNRARIEVVKREGRGLIRAQHPGSAKIQEFLGQLEVLWEELRRRHQRNAVFLQASQELGFRAVKVLQALGSLEAWLESVELSMRESSLAGDPDTMSRAERESRLLEREVSARGLELSALRQEVDRLRGQSHPHAQGLPARMDQVERKYHSVQSALTQQSSELQDTRMLTEFLERVELEESQEFSRGCQYSLGQPLHSDITSTPTTLLGLVPGSGGGGGGEPLMESMGDPVEELREAVEMLNDTVRERGRSHSHDLAIHQLLSKHTSLAARVEESACRSKALSADILERETDMAVKCEPDRYGLRDLQERQDRLEMDYEAMGEEVRETERQASRLEELCPERVSALGAKIRATLPAWTEGHGRSMEENRGRLREFLQLQDFFRSYLAMISWTEDTRACIFSDTALYLGKDGQESLAAKLDLQIEQRFVEFEVLAATGRDLLDAEHHLAEMVRERMEELRSMLAWISVHWRAQKQQWLLKVKRGGGEQPCSSHHDNIYSETCTVGTPQHTQQSSTPDPEPCRPHHQSLAPSACVDAQSAPADGRPPPAQTLAEQQGDEVADAGYEVMNSIGPRGGGGDLATTSSESPCNKPPVLLLKDPCSAPPALGGTVNLILSFGHSGDSRVEVLESPPMMEEVAEESCEPVHRVSTYLHVTDNNNMALTPVYESITLPRQTARPSSSASASSSLSRFSPSPPSSPQAAPATAWVASHSLPRSGSSSIFSSLKRMGKKRKWKRDARRHTIQKIMGVEECGGGDDAAVARHCACEPVVYDTRTWPLKEGRSRKKNAAETSAAAMGGGVELTAYMKNPLLKDMDVECSGEDSITPYAVSEGPSVGPSAGQVRSHCRLLSLGSVLSFDLPKDVSLIPSIQDIITIAHPEAKKGAVAHPDRQRQSALSSFKRTRASAPDTRSSPAALSVDVAKSLPESHARVVVVKDLPRVDTGLRSPKPPPSPEEDEEDQAVPGDNLSELRRSGVVSLHAERDQEWDCHAEYDGRERPSRACGGSPPHAARTRCCTESAHHHHDCLSVHTLLKDLHGHQYHQGVGLQSGHEEESTGLQLAQPGPSQQASHMVVNLKSTMSISVREDSVDSGVSSSGSFKLCTEAPCSVDNPQPCRAEGPCSVDNPQPCRAEAPCSVDNPQPCRAEAPCSVDNPQPCRAEAPCSVMDNPQPCRAVVGRLVSLEVGGIVAERSKARTNSVPPPPPSFARSPDSAESAVAAVEAEPVHPDHQQFEEVEAEPVHPDHQQFEEVEEELEDIWNRSANSYRQSICSDIMYQPHTEEEAATRPEQPNDSSGSPGASSPRGAQTVLYRNLITASAPNLLVAQFRLPSSVQNLLAGDKEPSPKDQRRPPLLLLAKGDRRSWAAFPNNSSAADQPCKPSSSSSVVNETASDPVKLPNIEDNDIYIYQYREEEEEEEEAAKEVGVEVEKPAGCWKDQPMSFMLSDHMGLDGLCQQQRMASQSLGNVEEQYQLMATGGRCNSMNGKPELLQSMEGTLERKQKLQLGGKKAQSRAWNSYHAVLYRHTLCFYQDRKDTLRSSVCGLPLNLIGAECAPVPEYTKKPNCFSLRLRDGSEYLLNACSRFMMKKWMLKLQANAGFSEAVPSSVFTSTFPRCKATSTGQAKEIVVLTRDHSHTLQRERLHNISTSHTSPCGKNYDFGSLKQTSTQRLSKGTRDTSPPAPSPAYSRQGTRDTSPPAPSPAYSRQGTRDTSPPAPSPAYSIQEDWLSSKPRSHSFTSATYQRIRPAALLTPPGGRGQEVGSSYSVTLVIGDKSSDSSKATVGWPQTAAQVQQDCGALRSYASLPRPRNKSVFKKFFGKKDGHL